MSRELFVEIRTEELPPTVVRPALEALASGLEKVLAGLSYGVVRTFATPRRLAVAIADVAPARERVAKRVTGPPAPPVAERDAEGAWKQHPKYAGFAKGKGRDAAELIVVEGPKGDVVGLDVETGGERTIDLVRAGLEGVIRAIPIERPMEWGDGGLSFSRPIRGIAAVYDGVALGGAVHGYALEAASDGHRRAPDTQFTFTDADDWATKLRARWVEPDLDLRKAAIQAELAAAAAELGADPIRDDKLVEEVLHLVEWPKRVIGEFDEAFLQLPPRLLVESMRVHQRTFPVHVGGRLTHRFVVISNAPKGDPRVIASGAARVLRPRFFDATFFFTEDQKQSLAEIGAGLVRMRWIKGLGSMAAKQARIADAGARLAAGVFGGTSADAAIARRAGALCKADLLSRMVNEFPELQGHVGRLYAAGEGAEAAIAIEEHYQPRFAGDALAATLPGAALALADRLDTLVGCFGVGQQPKGGSDPQGLRRAALGVWLTLVEHQADVDLGDLFGEAVDAFHAAVVAAPDGFEGWKATRGLGAEAKDKDALVAALVEFVLARFEAQAVADGASGDHVQAILVGDPRPVTLTAKLAALRAVAATPDFVAILQTFKRVLNISAKAEGNSDDRAFVVAAESALDAAVTGVSARVEAAVGARDYRAALEAILALKAPVAAFFDDVLVDDPDPVVKARRVGLLHRISGLFRGLADFGRISSR